MLQGKLNARIKEEHDGRSPFLSHHLDRARQEEKELANPSARSHSHSHARHCDPAGGITGGSIGAALPHSHAPHTHATPAILPAHALAISDDGSLLATIGADPTSIVLLSTDTLRQVRLLTTASLPVARLSFVQHSRELAVILSDQSWQRFSVAEGQLLTHIQPTPALRFKQELVLSKGQEVGGLAFAAAAAGAPMMPIVGATCTSAAMSPLNLFLLTGSNESLLRVWDFHSKPHAPHFQSFTAHQTSLMPQEGITSMQFSPDGRKLITTGGDAIWIWNVKANERESLDQLKRRMTKRQIEDQRTPHSLPTVRPHGRDQLTLGYRAEDFQEEEDQKLQSYAPEAAQEEEESQQEEPEQPRQAWGSNAVSSSTPQQQQPLYN